MRALIWFNFEANSPFLSLHCC